MERMDVQEEVTPEIALENKADKLGVRRMRRSFRLCVATLVMFTGILWISERTLRYDLNESQFIIALTHETESARAILRHVVKRDSELKEFPTARYVAALAEREEDDLILPTYEKAYKLDPTDSFLVLRYGCKLFQQEHYAEARERFREAAVQQPKNALPKYLEAVASAFANGEKDDFSESLALVAKANAAGDAVAFPQPLWADNLPPRGIWYERLRRQILDECCAPFYRYADLVLGAAKHQVNLKQTEYWDQWLATLQQMAERLAFSGQPGTIQATAGVRIQLTALGHREQISAIEHGTPASTLIERRAKLESILDLLNQFEQAREARINADRRRFMLPLQLMGLTFGLLLPLWILASLTARATRGRSAPWVLPHSELGIRVLGTTSLLFLLFVTVFGLLQFNQAPPFDIGVKGSVTVSPWFARIAVLWLFTLAGTLLFAVVYPALQLNCPAAAQLRQRGQSAKSIYFTFLRRYYGIQIGLALSTVSIWTIGYRVFTSLYPWQLEILTTGLGEQETKVINLIMSLLSLKP